MERVEELTKSRNNFKFRKRELVSLKKLSVYRIIGTEMDGV